MSIKLIAKLTGLSVMELMDKKYKKLTKALSKAFPTVEKSFLSKQHLNRLLNCSVVNSKILDIRQGVLEEVSMTIINVSVYKLSDIKKVMAGLHG